MPDAFARLLRRMMNDGSVPRSQISARSMKELQSLFDVGALTQTRSGGGLVIKVCNAQTLMMFFRLRYPSDGNPVEAPPRARAVGMLRNAKRVGRTNMEPVLFRAIGPAICTRDGAQFDLQSATVRTGAACLILEPGRFWTLTAHVAIVENLECFLHFEKMHVSADVALYASGRLSELVLAWIRSPEMAECRFVHCGDYDPVGIDEFLRLKAEVGDRATLHIPDDLAGLVTKYGRQELLRDSTAVFRRIRGVSDESVRKVVDILQTKGRGLEQEALLLDN